MVRNLEELVTSAFPEHQPPPLLSQFMDQWNAVERDEDGRDIYLYHGTNCFRRWEINRAGSISPGRSGYSFYCVSAADAYRYARASCMRDTEGRSANSLVSEPVVLKVKFTSRTWIQADFVQTMPAGSQDDRLEVSVAVLGPVPAGNITEVAHCHHERHLADRTFNARSFADGSLRSGTLRLRHKTGCFRLDAYLLRKLCSFIQALSVWMKGSKPPEVTVGDELKRLARANFRS